MTDGIEIDVSQLASLARDMRAAGPRVSAAAKLIVRKTSLDIERDAKIMAPVRTGNLRNSIGVDNSGSNAYVSRASIGPTASYGLFVEIGTSRMAPRPYLKPAFDRHEGAFHAALDQLLEEETP
jgi:HK97 gp10 family phage protein